MDASQLKRSLVQTLENYRRCGLSRIHKLGPDQIAANVLESVQRLVTEAKERDKTSKDEAASIGHLSAIVSQVQPEVSAEEFAVQSTVRTGFPTPSTGSWTLPVMDDAERQLRFDGLDAKVKACRACEKIVDFRRQTVFGVGTLRPTVCFMGEAPGADEDRLGEPFVGKAGQLLNKIISAMTLKREEVYILNALKCRPPQNRTPLPGEVENCRHFVENQLEVLQPQYIVLLGAVAVRSILQNNDPVGRLRGRFHAYRGAKVVVTYHPSYLLRNEDAKRLVWEDMKMLMSEMGLRAK